MKIAAIAAVLIGFALPVTAKAADARLAQYISNRIGEFDEIPDERRDVLAELADYVRARHKAGDPIRLTFICTHNSRRSQMAQVWAAVAAAHYQVKEVETFSGGTEATTFNSRAVAALARAGMQIRPQPSSIDGDNVKQAVTIPGRKNPLVCFSKVYNESPNPEKDFAAVMTCSEADKNCPDVPGASVRIALPYDDPKQSDGADRESEIYDERCRQIAREMLYVFSVL